MFDEPRVDELLAAVSAWLRDGLAPGASAGDAFQARVAANALDLVRRELSQGPVARAEARQRLHALLNPDAPRPLQPGDMPDASSAPSLDALQAELARRIRERTLTLDSPGLLQTLQQHTLAKMAIEQPGHALFRQLQAAAGGASPMVPATVAPSAPSARSAPPAASPPSDDHHPTPPDGLRPSA